MISSTTTVREVAVQIPQSTRLFETLKIDYCCGGNRPLTDACEAAGVEVDNVIAMLTVLGQGDTTGKDSVDFQHLSLTELVNHILETHHVFTKSEMDRITALIAKVSNAHSANHPELFNIANVFQQLCEDLRPHMFKEEQVLFPYITALEAAKTQQGRRPFAPFGTVANPVRMMMMEHETAGGILRELRTLTSDYKPPADACTSYLTLYRAMEEFEKDLYQHIHLENNLLFPKSMDLERAE